MNIKVLPLSFVLFFASLCVGQATDPGSQPATQESSNLQTSVADENSHPAPVTPEVAVPTARDGKDEAGRAVQPIGATEPQGPPPVSVPEQ